MGDAADDSFDNDYDDWDGFGNYDDYEDGSYIGPLNRRGPKTIVCKYCKQSGFHWKQLPNGQWRLFDQYGMHSCKEGKDASQTSKTHVSR